MHEHTCRNELNQQIWISDILQSNHTLGVARVNVDTKRIRFYQVKFTNIRLSIFSRGGSQSSRLLLFSSSKSEHHVFVNFTQQNQTRSVSTFSKSAISAIASAPADEKYSSAYPSLSPLTSKITQTRQHSVGCSLLLVYTEITILRVNSIRSQI